jgi:hypothetical protein
MEKKTLDEAAAEYANKELSQELTSKVGNFYGFSSSFIEGAKYQAERMYSEKEVRELLTQRSKHWGTSVKPFDKLLLRQDLEWFEQNKKK